MKLFFQTSILLICFLALFLAGCTKIRSRGDQESDEESIKIDAGNGSVDSVKIDSGRSPVDSVLVKADSGDKITPIQDDVNIEEHVDSSIIDNNNKTDSDTDAEEIGCDVDELLCDETCVPNDEKNCGECGHDCTALAHVVGSVECEDGKCVLTPSSCESGWADCNEDSEDGCETNITEAKNCGGCGNDCSETTKPLCAPIGGDEGYECAADCPSDAPTLCGDSCVNTENSPLHCGECDKECKTYPSSRPICEDAKCDFECNDDSHLKCPNGCFPNDAENCGTCGNVCGEGQRCSNNSCICDRFSCPIGCCDEDGQCQQRSTTTCGTRGERCEMCNLSNEVCNYSGECVCDPDDYHECDGSCISKDRCCTSSDCPTNHECQDGNCVETQFCGNGVIDGDEECELIAGSGWRTDNCNADTCERTVYTPCEDDNDCASYLHRCTEYNQCSNSCLGDTDPENPASCATIPGYNRVCLLAGCILRCSSSDQCPSGLICFTDQNDPDYGFLANYCVNPSNPASM